MRSTLLPSLIQLVVVAIVRNMRVSSFFVWQITHQGALLSPATKRIRIGPGGSALQFG
jgi:hypothetical protein